MPISLLEQQRTPKSLNAGSVCFKQVTNDLNVGSGSSGDIVITLRKQNHISLANDEPSLDRTSMDIDIATPALLFPAISLLLLAYTNRFIALASIVRQLRKNLVSCDQRRLKQIESLRKRLSLIKTMQAMGVLALMACVISMFLFYTHSELSGGILFALALVLMFISLIFALVEILMSGKALAFELENINELSSISPEETRQPNKKD